LAVRCARSLAMRRSLCMIMLALAAPSAAWQRAVAAARARPLRANAAEITSDTQELLETYTVARAKAERARAKLSRPNPVVNWVPKWADWLVKPQLQPHDIPVITLEKRVTADALERLLSHRACAVHVRGFLDEDTRSELQAALSNGGLFSNWQINRLAASGTTSEVDKVGVTDGEALDSFDAFRAYVRTAETIDGMLERNPCPFEALRQQLDDAHPEGCRRDRVGRWPMPIGTYRRMCTSSGLVHADTSPLLSEDAGEFSANIYVSTPEAKGDLNIYPAMQYSAWVQPALQSLSRALAQGYDPVAQGRIRDALPLKVTVPVADGDLIMINTGRFHEVEAYDEGERLSGQCWVSFRRGKPLYMWI